MSGQTDLLNTEKKSKILAFTSLAHFINDGGLFTMPLIFAILTSEKIVSTLTIAVMPIIFYGASLLLSMYIANLSDRTERQGLLVGLGLGLLSAGLIGFAISMSYASGTALEISVLLSAFVAGLGTAFYHPIGAAILQAIYTDKSKGKALGINGSIGSLGRALYPSFFFVIASVITENGAIAILALVGVIASIIISTSLTKKGGRSPSNSNPKNQSKEVLGPLRERITTPLIMLTLIAFVSAFATQGIAAWIPTYLALQKGFGITSSLGIALSGMYAAAIIGQPVFGYLVDKFEKRLILAISIIGSALSIVGYLFASGSLDMILLVLLGLFTFSGFPIFLSLASDYVPKKASSLSNALVWSLGVNGGGVVGPAVIGAVALSGYVSWSFAFEMMAVAAFVSVAMIPLLRKPLKSSKMAIFGG
jgi:FSR family fosmidomycin resistance protein-like MFS transporter